jgi:hypothetical protein
MATEVSNADFTFGEPVNLGPPVNTSVSDGTPCISPDGLSLYFTSNRPGGSGGHDLWIASRSSKDDAWSSPTNLGPKVNSPSLDYFPSISADGLSLFFYSARGGGRGQGDIWVTTRSNLTSSWNNATNLGSAINSPQDEASPHISSDSLSLIFASNRPGGDGNYDLYISKRPTTNSPWSAASNFGSPINSPHLDVAPSLSSDELTLFFHSIRPGGYGNYDLYFSQRQSLDAGWSAPINIGSPVNSSYSELGPSLSGDGCTLYWSDHYINPPRPGGLGIDDLWQVSISPVVDLNDDGIVDSTDVSIMIDHWGENYTLCDIGPTPFGDGIIDVEDLKILSEYLFGDMQSVAHFKLDETKGSIANDSAMNRDGTVHGNPEWQPMGGNIGGALLLDGFDDYIMTRFVLNPVDAVLSVFAWINGGTPGQVIISQMNGANWLLVDPTEGNLMTELQSSNRSGKPLLSQTVVTDGNWHRIGLVWDGSHRTLYVDGVAVAEDTQDDLGGSDSGLYIGCGRGMEPGTYFSGLIDDVRIYNRVVIP